MANKTVTDLSKPVRTKGGLAARVLCVDLDHAAYPVVVAVTYPSGREHLCYYKPDGISSGQDRDYDLVNMPEEKSYFRAYHGGSKTGVRIYPTLSHCRVSSPYSTILEFVEEDGKLVRVKLHQSPEQ